MTINTEIYPILKEFNIGQEDGVSYLLMKYFGLKPTYIPEILIAQMNRTGIYFIDNNNSLQWRLPLFNEQETAFDWVKKEYVQLFVDANPDKRGNGNSSVRLMKAFFAANPEVRKEEVIEATKMYIRNNDSRYIRLSHYFISKGRGANKIEELKDWIEKYRLWQNKGQGRTSTATTMQ
jgi:hypothetical protein